MNAFGRGLKLIIIATGIAVMAYSKARILSGIFLFHASRAWFVNPGQRAMQQTGTGNISLH
jgi:hypothetical protein